MPSSQITPDETKFLLGFLQPTLKNEHGVTKKVIAAIPLDKSDYRPEPVAKTALELAWHICCIREALSAGGDHRRL